mgnify:CR=1 FL=1
MYNIEIARVHSDKRLGFINEIIKFLIKRVFIILLNAGNNKSSTLKSVYFIIIFFTIKAFSVEILTI